MNNYRQDVKEFADCYEAFGKGGEFHEEHPTRQHYTKGLPVFISEYGGIKWNPSNDVKDAWGYGDGPKTEEEFIDTALNFYEDTMLHDKVSADCKRIFDNSRGAIDFTIERLKGF